MRNLSIWTSGALLCLSFLHPRLISAETAREESRRIGQAARAAAFEQLMAGVETLEILTLDSQSGWDSEAERKSDNSSRLEKWRILRRAQVTKSVEIDLLRTGLKRSIEEGEMAAKCFEPRHGLVFKKGGVEIKVLVCFECQLMQVSGGSDFGTTVISPSAEKEFFQVLHTHGLTKPDRLRGIGDPEIVRRLTGTWTSEHEPTPGTVPRIVFRETNSLRPDGSFLATAEITETDDKASSPSVRHHLLIGKWRVRDTLLFITIEKVDGATKPDPFSQVVPIMEVSETKLVLGVTRPDDETESAWKRGEMNP